MKPILSRSLLAVSAGASLTMTAETTAVKQRGSAEKPNVIVIYADDLGYGDVSCYGATALKTPNLDRLAHEGVKFTSGYATAATCTPSRYSILTGKYPFRNKRAQVLAGDAPALITDQEPTLPKMMKKAGYSTGIVGKWHLGMGRGNLDWNKYIPLNPNEIGFDYSFIMAATNDRVPTVYVENGHVVNLDPKDPITVTYNWNAPNTLEFKGLPTGKQNPEMLKQRWSHGHDMSITNGISRIGYMKGGTAALWIDENQAEEFLVQAEDFVNRHKDEPFFLCYHLHQPHVPRIPSPRFRGKSGLGPRGDVILEADWYVGEFLDTLDELGLAENTLIVFSSDNGPVLDDGYEDQAAELLGDHTPAGVLRGGKYSTLEGGTRVPFMVRFPAKVKGGQVSDAIVSQMDLFGSLAAMLNQKNESQDSIDTLGALLGKSKIGRKSLVINSKALRQGDYLYIPAKIGRSWGDSIGIDSGNRNEAQLYNVVTDPGQTNNIAAEKPDLVKAMAATLTEAKK